jgi:competence ComEA-like helix-hairpin-helix protein
MDSIESHDLTPDPEPEKPRFRLERVEAALIVLLLVLIAAGNLIPRLLPERSEFPITVRHSPSNSNLPPIDWTATPVPPKVQRRDLNSVSRADLIELPGIGPSLADTILAYKDQHGPFRRIEDLDLITGIGPRKLESMRQFLFVHETAAATPAPTPFTTIPPLPVSASAGPRLEAAPMAGPLNLNTATLEQLMGLPGIGEIYARRILERRTQLGRFHTWAEVASVPGVGAKRLENIQRYATIR